MREDELIRFMRKREKPLLRDIQRSLVPGKPGYAQGVLFGIDQMYAAVRECFLAKKVGRTLGEK